MEERALKGGFKKFKKWKEICLFFFLSFFREKLNSEKFAHSIRLILTIFNGVMRESLNCYYLNFLSLLK